MMHSFPPSFPCKKKNPLWNSAKRHRHSYISIFLHFQWELIVPTESSSPTMTATSPLLSLQSLAITQRYPKQMPISCNICKNTKVPNQGQWLHLFLSHGFLHKLWQDCQVARLHSSIIIPGLFPRKCCIWHKPKEELLTSLSGKRSEIWLMPAAMYIFLADVQYSYLIFDCLFLWFLQSKSVS